MYRKALIIATAASAVLLPFALVGSATAAGSKPGGGSTSYKWVDEHGVTHYGDAVPPEYSSLQRSELNSRGVAVREYPRQLSPEEAVEAQKSAAAAAKQRQHDSFLLMTYTKVSDIENLRDERLALIDAQMEIARGSINAADQHMQALEARVRNFQPYSTATNARRLPDQLAEEVVRTMKERRMLVSALTRREKEKAEVRGEFNSDIARYRELTARPKPR